MPRSNHPRRRTSNARGSSKSPGRGPQGGGAMDEDGDGFDMNRARLGTTATESAPDGVWAVRTISAGNAQKSYTCPGCHRAVPPGLAHLVVWQEDAMFGAEAGLRDRRHWHSNCWRGRSYRYR
ncbi:ATP/GTP-binding protein [Arthrobacter sp. BF1]|uniref:ATP/GTP-binding protein n=1 Tax=Arthrobacter sp. BF1 TaxID=2821145 RepID=UPI001C4FE2A0|nr:ATP/GTP-binding protein [Arthrobacter sp. BF1]